MARSRLSFAIMVSGALTAGLLSGPATAGAAASAGAAPPAPGAARPIPPTVSRTVALSLRGLAGGRAGLTVGGGALRSLRAVRTAPQVVCPGFRFTAVGLVWRGTDGDIVLAHIRTAGAAGGFGPGRIVRNEPDEGPSPGSPDYDPHRQAADLLWTGPRRCIRLSLQLSSGADLSRVRAAFVNTSGTAGSIPPGAQVERSAAALAAPRVRPTVRAGMDPPPVISRAQWGASPRFLDTGTPGCRAPYYSPQVKVAYVHHTAGSNSYGPSQSDDVVRSIYWFHTQQRGYCDIAYNFLISKYGQIFEGRAGGIDQPVTPASQAGFNPNTFSVSVMGNFETAYPSRATISALERLLAWRLNVAHVPAMGRDTLVSQGGATTRYPAGTRVRLPTVVGHRVTGLTSCPGYHLFVRIPAIRRAVARMGLPKILRPRQSALRLRPVSSSVRLTAAATARLEWTVSIRDRRGELIRTLSHRGQSLSVAWNGTDGSGHPVPGGKYRAFVAGRDAVGHRALPAMLPMEVLGSRSSSVARPSGPRRTTRPKPDEVAAATGGFRVLDAVAGTGPDDVWAVGGTMTGPVRGHALVFHRSSAGWRQIPVPSPGTTASLLSVDSAAPGDVWAVGYRCARASCAGGGFGERSLIERGSNGSWQAVPSPNPDTGGDRLNAVAAISPTDAWAVGEAFDEGIYLHQPLLVHWNGARWTAANAPRIPGEDVNMSGLLALSPTDVWAVGHGCLGGRGCGGTPLIRPVVLHYDGVRWAVVSTVRLTAAGSSLQDIVGNGPADLTAAGWRARTRHGNSRPLGERRVNGRWRVGWAPAFGGILFGADTAPGAPVWTVGDRRSRGGFRTLAVRRTPGGWRAVASPTPRGRMSSLSSVAVLSRHDVWATGPSVSGPFLLHWNGARWSLVHPG